MRSLAQRSRSLADIERLAKHHNPYQALQERSRPLSPISSKSAASWIRQQSEQWGNWSGWQVSAWHPLAVGHCRHLTASQATPKASGKRPRHFTASISPFYSCSCTSECRNRSFTPLSYATAAGNSQRPQYSSDQREAENGPNEVTLHSYSHIQAVRPEEILGQGR